MRTDSLYEMTIFLKNGETLLVVNHLENLKEVAEDLVCADGEYDGGMNPVEIRGVRLVPDPGAVVLLIQPWNVAAVQLVELTAVMMRGLKGQLRGTEI